MTRRTKAKITTWENWSYAVALQKVGQTVEQQLAWLIRFADSKLTPALEQELLAFWAVRMLQRAGYDDRVGAFSEVPSDLRLPTTPAHEEVALLHENLRRQLQSLKMNGTFSASQPSDNILVWANPHIRGKRPQGEQPKSSKPWHMLLLRRGNFRETFDADVLDVLLSLGDRLRLCPPPHGCGGFFAANRQHQVFCGTRCANRAGQARFRAAKASLIAARRRERYAEQQRAKLGKRVKVGRKAQPSATKLQPARLSARRRNTKAPETV